MGLRGTRVMRGKEAEAEREWYFFRCEGEKSVTVDKYGHTEADSRRNASFSLFLIMRQCKDDLKMSFLKHNFLFYYIF